MTAGVPEFKGTVEAADELRVSRQRVFQLVSSGVLIPAVRVGTAWGFSAAEIARVRREREK